MFALTFAASPVSGAVDPHDAFVTCIEDKRERVVGPFADHDTGSAFVTSGWVQGDGTLSLPEWACDNVWKSSPHRAMLLDASYNAVRADVTVVDQRLTFSLWLGAVVVATPTPSPVPSGATPPPPPIPAPSVEPEPSPGMDAGETVGPEVVPSFTPAPRPALGMVPASVPRQSAPPPAAGGLPAYTFVTMYPWRMYPV